MEIGNQQELNLGTDLKWFSSPVSVNMATLPNIGRYIPSFERRSFALTQPGNERSRLNERLDMIVRQPIGADEDFVPVGVVSKDYTLVPHLAVVDVVAEALKEAKISPDGVLTQGNRMFNSSLP